MRQLSSAPEGQSVSNSWFSPQRSGGEVQEFAAQLPHSPRAERGENIRIKPPGHGFAFLHGGYSRSA